MEQNINSLAGYVRESQLVRKDKHQTQPTILPFSGATLWRKIRAGEFPKPMKLGPRINAWPVEVVRDWLAAHGNK